MTWLESNLLYRGRNRYITYLTIRSSLITIHLTAFILRRASDSIFFFRLARIIIYNGKVSANIGGKLSDRIKPAKYLG